MRINAKEHDIVKNLASVQEKSEMEELCDRFFSTFFQPIKSLGETITQLVCAYVGGRLAQDGRISASDLAGFSFSAVTLLNQFNSIKRVLWCLYNMNDRRFRAGFDIMDLLCKKPKIGIDGGWQPTKLEKDEAGKQTKAIARQLIKEEAHNSNNNF